MEEGGEKGRERREREEGEGRGLSQEMRSYSRRSCGVERNTSLLIVSI